MGRRILRVVCFLMRRREGHAPRRLSARGLPVRWSPPRPAMVYWRKEHTAQTLSRDTRSHPQVGSRAEPAARGWGEASSKNRSAGSCLRVTRLARGFFACPQPQPHLRAGGVSTPQTGGSERLLDAGADDDERVLLSLVD